MKILALSTSSNILSIAVSSNDKILSYFHKDIKNQHSSNIIEKVKITLNSANRDISDVDLFGVDIGPGSFTGLRVGVTAVKMAAKVLEKPVVGISSLDIIAAGMSGKEKLKSVILDAKRKKVYSIIYRNDKMISEHLLTDIDGILNYIDSDVVFSGDGISIYKSEILNKLSNVNVEFMPEDKWYPSASNLAKLAIKKYDIKGTDDVDRLVPKYIYSKECSIKGI